MKHCLCLQFPCKVNNLVEKDIKNLMTAKVHALYVQHGFFFHTTELFQSFYKHYQLPRTLHTSSQRPKVFVLSIETSYSFVSFHRQFPSTCRTLRGKEREGREVTRRKREAREGREGREKREGSKETEID